jgi:Zn-dependent protease
MDLYQIITTLAILLFSAIVHEVSHGLMAEKLGDDTAREEGRITLNPIPHIDPFGSILLPLVLLLAHSPIIFGAAKPVPVNFNRLRNPKSGMALVSLAGPLSNFLLAILFVGTLKLGLQFNFLTDFSTQVLYTGIILNLVLGVFNLIPIPPLDGSKILVSLGSDRFMYALLSYERSGFILVIIFLYLGILDRILVPIIDLFGRIFGINLF